MSFLLVVAPPGPYSNPIVGGISSIYKLKNKLEPNIISYI